MIRWTSLFSLILLAGIVACRSAAPESPLQHGGPGFLALTGVTVIDGLGNAPVPDQVVLLRGDKIEAILPMDRFRAAAGTRLLDHAGRFVIPGLIDMHAHVTILPMDERGRISSQYDRLASEEVLRTLLDFGVTTVRNPAAPARDGVELRDAVASGAVVGPQILTAGNPLNRTAAHFGPFVATPDVEAVREEVRRQAEIGVDCIKVYASLPPTSVQAAIEEAHALGLPVVGHLQRTTWTEAARFGIDSIAHGAPWSAAYLPEGEQAGYTGSVKGRMDWLEHVDFDGPKIREMIEIMRAGNVSVDPTLIAYRTKFYGDDPRYRQHPEIARAPELVRSIWQRASFTGDWSTEDYARGHQVWPRVLELARRLHEGGVMLTAGSDMPNPWIIPGVSFHEELELLHEAGIPPIDVLRIATWNGAQALGMADQIGSIESGKQADLVVLANDPSIDIRSTRSIVMVIADGRVIDRTLRP